MIINILSHAWPILFLVAVVFMARAYFRRIDSRVIWVKNPLTKHRNVRCPCGSGLKVKRCCGLIERMPPKTAKIVDQWIVVHGLK